MIDTDRAAFEETVTGWIVDPLRRKELIERVDDGYRNPETQKAWSFWVGAIRTSAGQVPAWTWTDDGEQFTTRLDKANELRKEGKKLAMFTLVGSAFQANTTRERHLSTDRFMPAQDTSHAQNEEIPEAHNSY